MKALSHLILSTLLIFLSFLSFAQCNINTGCTEDPFLNIDPPIFDVATSTIIFNNIIVGGIGCNAAIFETGVSIYIYQLLPNGERMELCSLTNPAPFNVISNLTFGFGQTNFCGLGGVNIGTITTEIDQGFQACDGALLEIEAVLYIAEGISFEPSIESVYTALSPDEFISIDLGTIDINTNNEFPGGGQPLTTAVINEFTTGSDGPLNVSCGDDVGLYVEGLSRLANCLPYSDILTGIPSELINVFSYTVNGGTPIIIPPSSGVASGGQLTGPDPVLGDRCYGGVLTPDGPYIFEWANLPTDLCNGSTVVVTIATTDVFTGITVSDDITIIYSGTDCNTCGDLQGCTDNTACNFDATATADDGSCLFNDCEGDCGGAAIEGTACFDANGNSSTYSIDCICTTCEEEITGVISAADDCDLGGIVIAITAPDGTSTNVTAESNGSFTVQGGPFPCGTYTAAFSDITQLPYCYTETGSVEPITFSLDGMDTEIDDFEFAANPNIPTLSQWGIVILVLLLMCFGAVKLVSSNHSFSLRK